MSSVKPNYPLIRFAFFILMYSIVAPYAGGVTNLFADTVNVLRLIVIIIHV